MCGLCGIVGPSLGSAEWELFKDLMIVSTLRGEDGAGIVAVPMKAGKEIDILRSEGSAAELATGMSFLRMRGGKWACFMGHARAPTSGTWNMADVHPHVSGPIIGMHNGTMLRVNGALVKKEDSDSRLLFNSIRNQGIENTLKSSHGAYALSYINKSTDQLCFVRNAARPLFFLQVDGLPFIAWASERGMLEMLCRRTPGLSDKTSNIYNLKTDMYLTFRVHNTGPVRYVDYRRIGTSPTTAPTETVVDPQHIIHAQQAIVWETKRGVYLDEDELKIALQTGCAYCNAPADITDYQGGKTFWHERSEFICHDCAKNDPVARAYLKSYGITPPSSHLN